MTDRIDAHGHFWAAGEKRIARIEALDEAAKGTKLAKLRCAMGRGDWRAAVLLAAKFPRLGAHKVDISKAREAYLRPAFQAQLGRDVDELKAAGRRALEARYGRG